MPHSNIDDRTRTTAKRLRRGQTDTKRKMWRLLRPFRDDGISFRRQAPFGVYIVDFVWLSGRLVIEVDGGQHNEAAGLVRDAARTQWIESQRFGGIALLEQRRVTQWRGMSGGHCAGN